MTTTNIDVPVDRYTQILTERLRARGATAEEAEAVVAHLLDADVHGDHGHGAIRLHSILRSVADAARCSGRWTERAPGALEFSGDRTIGYLVLDEAVARVDAELERSPAVVARVGGTTHVGRLGYYTRKLAQRGHAAFAATQARRWMTAPGGTSAVLGSTAFSVALPTEPLPMVVDLSPLRVSASAMRLASVLGKPLPDGAAFDPAGAATRDARRVAKGGALAPAAGAKGFALGVLAAALATLAGGVPVPHGDDGYGTLMIGARPDVLGDAAAWSAVEQLFHEIERSGARVPGSRYKRPPSSDGTVALPRLVWDEMAGHAPAGSA